MDKKEEVKKQVESISKSLIKPIIGDTNKTYEKRLKQCEFMLLNLCEMYKIAYS